MRTFWAVGLRIKGILCFVVSAGLLGDAVASPNEPAPAAPQKTVSLEVRLGEKERAAAQLELLGFPRSGEAFIRTIASTHRPLIDLYLASGIDPNAVDGEGRSALLAATIAHDWELASRLLAAGADPRKADHRGVTPLMAAASAGHLATVKALRERGADAEVPDESGRTACHYAIASRQTATLAELLNSGVPVPGPTRDGREAAGLACETNDRQMIELVLDHQSGKAAWSPAARAAFGHALAERDLPFVRLLVSRFEGAPAPDNDAQPFLAYAVVRNDLEQLQTLLDCGADPNTILDKPGDTVLRELVPASFMKYYLDREPGMTALSLAAGLKRTESARLLVEKGANRNLATLGKSKLYPLYFAAWAESPDTMQVLLGNAPSRDKLRIEISLNGQRAKFIRDGAVVLSTEISTGRSGFDTKPGEFVITDKHLEHRSTLYHDASMPYFMRLSCQAFGLHEGYVTGRPASHGCIRLPGAVARRLFKEAPVGTWVSITR